MTCLVPFCRGGCPVLPDGAGVRRGSGRCVCDECGLTLDEHQKYAYPSGMSHVVLCCDGVYYHL